MEVSVVVYLVYCGPREDLVIEEGSQIAKSPIWVVKKGNRMIMVDHLVVRSYAGRKRYHSRQVLCSCTLRKSRIISQRVS